MAEEEILNLPFRYFFNNAAFGIALADQEGVILTANPAFARLVGEHPQDISGRNFLRFISTEKKGDVRDILVGLVDSPFQKFHAELPLIHKNGQIRLVLLAGTTIPDTTGKPRNIMFSVAEIPTGVISQDNRMRAAVAEEYSELQYRKVLDSVPYPVLFVNDQQRITWINKHAELSFGYVMLELLGRPLAVLFPELSWEPDAAMDGREFTSPVSEKSPYAVYAMHKNGVRHPVMLDFMNIDNANRRDWVINVQILSETNAREDASSYSSWYDPVTRLYNRVLFQERLGHAITRAEREAKKLGVLVLDIDRFKQLNDSYGYEAGNQSLKEIGDRIISCMRKSDTIARLGSDQFAILLEGVDQAERISTVVQKLIGGFSNPFSVQNEDVYLTASIGLSVYPVDGLDVENLMKNAESAMLLSKKEGGNGFHFYTREMSARAKERMQIDRELHHALNREEFVLHYQPMLDASGKKTIALEALLRWNHPDKGLIPPLTFIPLLEELGLIVQVGNWILRTACRQIKLLQGNGHGQLRLAVNVSARQISQHDFSDNLKIILQETGLEPKALELEITESVLIQNADKSEKILESVAELGVSIALDDFGTGYSSLAYLKRFPIHTLKIDRNFVKGLPDKRDDVAITDAILALARSLGIKVVAEGVETEEQHAFLRDHHCHQMQGFLFARPMPSEELDRWLVANRSGRTPHAHLPRRKP